MNTWIGSVRVLEEHEISSFNTTCVVLRDLVNSTETNERWLTLNNIFAVCQAYHDIRDKEPFVQTMHRILSKKQVEYRSRKSITLFAVEFVVPRFQFGLFNPDVRCYLNVALVLFWKNPILRSNFNFDTNVITSAIKGVFDELDAQAMVVSTNGVKQAMHQMKLWKEGHQDAAELIYYLMSFVTSADIGIKYSYAYFYGGKQISNTTIETEAGFNLSVNGNTSVTTEVKKYFEPMAAEYKFHNKVVQAEKRASLLGSGKVLFVNINRFSTTDLRNKLTFAINIDDSIVIGDDRYYLHCVISHQGSAMEGHYRIMVNENMKLFWNEYDDGRVIRQTHHRLHDIRGGNATPCASFLVYIKQACIGEQFATLLSSSESTTRTRGRTVSVAFDLSEEEDDSVPRPQAKRTKQTKQHQQSYEFEPPVRAKQKPNQAATQSKPSKKTIPIGDMSDLTQEVYTEISTRLTQSHIKCIYLTKILNDVRQWLVKWSKPQGKPSINWLLETNISTTLRGALNVYFRSPVALTRQGWQEPTFTPVYKPQKTFSHSLVGPHTKETDPLKIFSKFINDDLIEKMVIEINRSARRSFDEANYERAAWRQTKLQTFCEWATKMEAKYPSLKQNESWTDRVSGLAEYFRLPTNTTFEARVKHNKKMSSWSDTTSIELKNFIGVTLAIRCVRGRRTRDYFNAKDPLYGNEFIADKISQARFEQLWHYLHIDLDYVMDQVAQNCEQNWTPSQKVTFDETIIHFLGRFYALRHIPSKPHPNGVLLYLLADSFKYVWYFDFWLGLCLPPKYQLLEIAEKLKQLQPNYTIITDSLWGSEDVATQLDKQDTKFLLSCKRDQPFYVFGHFQDNLKDAKVGSHQSRIKPGHRAPITALTFKDSNAYINVISNYINDTSSLVIPCPGVTREKSAKPLAIQEYTFAKGYVDEVARQLHTFDWPHKIQKWPHVIWNTLLNISTWNSFVYRKANTNDKLTYREFLQTLAKQLTVSTRGSPSKLSRKRNDDGTIALHDISKRHVRVAANELGRTRKFRPCSKCKKKQTMFICLGCSKSRWIYVCCTCSAKHREKLQKKSK